MTQAEQLFKFVAVRPPTPVGVRDAVQAFIHYVPPSDGEESLVASVLAAPDWESARQLAEAVIDQAAADLAFQGVDHAAGLVAVSRSVATGLRDAGSAEDVEATLGAPLSAVVGRPAFIRAKAAFFDLYTAHSLLPADRPGQRELVLLLLRTLHTLERIAANRNLLQRRDVLARVLTARVILPTEVLTKATAAPSQPQTPSPTPSQTPSQWPSQAPYYTQENVDRLKNLTAVDADLRRARRRNRDELTRPGTRPEQPREHPREQPREQPRERAGAGRQSGAGIGEHVPATAATATPTRILTPTVVASLKTPTRDFLNTEGIALDRIDVDEALDLTETRVTELRNLIFQGVPTSTMVRVDRLVSHAEIDQQLPPLEGLPTIPSPGAPKPVGTSEVPRVGTVRPVGVGDLLLVEQTLERYEAGEISYVENVLRTESLSRTFRTLNRVEQTVFSTTTTSSETERDLQTADRYELGDESQKTIAQDQGVQTGITVSGGYGPVQIGTQADFATSTSTSESQSTSLTFAQDVTDRSLSRLTTQVREGQRTKVVTESEETNAHGFDNTDGQVNIAGIYQWLDKHYTAQLYNYGRRLMFEFLVPKPAAFYRYGLAAVPADGVTVDEPEDLGDLQPADLKEGNYQDYVARYQVTGVDPPPAETTTASVVFDQSGLPENAVITKSASVQVPAGYRAKYGRFQSQRTFNDDGSAEYLFVLIGAHQRSPEGNENVAILLEDEEGAVPTGVLARGTGLLVTIEIDCVRSSSTLQAWQQATYEAVVSAYNAQLAAYRSQVSQAAVNAPAYGGSETTNRQVEQEELKKGSITLLSRQYFELLNAMHDTNTASGYPEFDVEEAMEEGPVVQFFEQAFEWDQMTYLFYPYFWMDKPSWAERANLQSTDAVFASFLRSGYARVLVPVTPSYRHTVLYYLTSGGQIWNGGDPPTIDDPLYVSLVDELEGAPEERVAVGEPWELVVPTTLVYLKEDSELPDFTS